MLWVFLSLIVLSMGLSQEELISGLQKMTPQDFRKVVCTDLERKHGLLKCAPENDADYTKQADAYINKFGMPEAETLAPVIILPGIAGSALQAKIAKHQAPHFWCWQNWDEWFRVWLPLVELLAQDCWFDNLRVIYDPATNEYTDPEGVTLDVMDFGGLGGIDYLDYWFGWPVPFTTYYSAMIKSLQKVGYQAGKNLFGAPFDWRVPSTAHELNEQGFYTRFVALIEHAYELNQMKVHILTHSLGGPTALAFLNGQPQEWKDRYIASFIPIAGPWAGAPKALRTSISGDNFGIEVFGVSLLSIEAVSKLAKQAGGLIELIPHPRFYSNTTAFVQQGKTNYTAVDFDKIYEAIGSPVSVAIHRATERVFDQWQPPQVPTYCIYGVGYKTEVFFNYENGFENQPTITYDENGDGTVPIESLAECQQWQGQQRDPVTVQELDLDHQTILEDEELFALIINITTSKQ